MDGGTLVGTTVPQLRKNKEYKVAIAGEIENYTKWLIQLRRCEVANNGALNVVPRSIHQGYREGFAGFKNKTTTSHAFHMFCTFHANDHYIHILFVTPKLSGEEHNSLAVAICPEKVTYCKNFNSKVMYKGKVGLVKSAEFYDEHTKPLKRCYGDFCFSGIMGVTSQAIIDMKIFPKKYDDLSRHVVVESFKRHWSNDDYKKFMKEMFEGEI